MKKLLLIILVLPLCKLAAQIPFNFNVPDVMIESSTNDPNTKYLSLGENSVYINPINPMHLLNGNNAAYKDPLNPQMSGQAIFYSDDGGNHWLPVSTSPNFITLTSASDPSVAIDHYDRKYFNYLSTTFHPELIYSVNNFLNISGPISFSTSSSDKNHFEIDDRPISDHIEYFSGWDESGHQFMYAKRGYETTNHTILWDPKIDLSDPAIFTPPISNFNFLYHQGINISVAPNGDAYATWGLYYGTNQANASEKFIAFSKWDHILQNWTTSYIPNLEISGIRNNTHIVDPLLFCNAISCASWITSAVNQQNGDIYITWPNVGIPCTPPASNCNCLNSTCNIDIYFIKSSDGGITWTLPITVNQSNGNIHWDSWLSCDPYTGYLGVIYYSKTGIGNTSQTSTYLSLSVDGGISWTEQQISDNFISSNPTFVQSKTDYISLKMNNGFVVPVWSGIEHINSVTSRQTAICQPFTMDIPISISLCNLVTPYYEIIKAQTTISLSDLGCGYEIPSGSYINMYASNYIKMSEGFHASEGSKFHAHIESVIDPFHANERKANEKDFVKPQNEESFYVLSYPNPFHDYVNINIISQNSTYISLDLYDNFGQLVKRLLNNIALEKGTSLYQISQEQLALKDGIYFCVATTSESKKTIKLVCINSK